MCLEKKPDRQVEEHMANDNGSPLYNSSGMKFFIFSMIFVFVFMFYISFLHKDIDLGQNEVDPHAPVAPGSAPAFDIAAVKEPWVSTPVPSLMITRLGAGAAVVVLVTGLSSKIQAPSSREAPTPD